MLEGRDVPEGTLGAITIFEVTDSNELDDIEMYSPKVLPEPFAYSVKGPNSIMF